MQAETSVTVLIGFADSTSAPEVAWSLVGSGFRVVAFAKRKTKPALRKSQLVRVEHVADPAESVEAAVVDLRTLVQHLKNPILMPLDDASLWLFQELLKTINVRIAGVTGRQAAIALDKRLQLDAAHEAGFAIPQTRPVVSAADLRTLCIFPAVVKPALAARAFAGSLGRGRSSYAIANAEELERLASKWDNTEPMLAQPLLSGVGEGLFGLVLEGHVVSWSAHRRVRMMNPAGSGASACVSIKPDSDACALAERFLRIIDWRGMFMIELLRDHQSRPWFMELNGRCWGSMALARRMGFEYPAWVIRSMVEPTFALPAPPETPPVLCRHLGRELLHLAFVWRGPRSQAYARWPGRLAALRDVLCVTRGDVWYNRNPGDPKVFWADGWETIISQLHWRERSRGILRRFVGRLKRPILRHQQAAIRASGSLENLLKGCGHILFLCYGNINRSALAEQHLKGLVGPDVQVFSCGFHRTDRRPLDPMMRSLGNEYGISFGVWSSRTINRQLVSEADLIFAMETAHLVRLFAEYPESRGRAFLLSCVTRPNTIPLEIRDPHGGNPDAYRRCIREITYATTSISKTVNHVSHFCAPRFT